MDNPKQPSLAMIEAALDKHQLWAFMRNGTYWLVRRNGVTKRWKREPWRFRIPIKAGWKSYGELTDETKIGYAFGFDFVISDAKPELAKRS